MTEPPEQTIAKLCEARSQDFHLFQALYLENMAMKGVLKSARNLEEWLSSNTGTNDDWPVEIKTDNPETAKLLSNMLTALKSSVRKCSEIWIPPQLP